MDIYQPIRVRNTVLKRGLELQKENKFDEREKFKFLCAIFKDLNIKYLIIEYNIEYNKNDCESTIKQYREIFQFELFFGFPAWS